MLNAEQAMQVVRDLIFTIQRMRSIYFETVGESDVSEKVGADLEPWVFGDKCLLPMLADIEDRGSIQPMELINLMMIAHTLDKNIATSATVFNRTLPVPDYAWLGGWK